MIFTILVSPCRFAFTYHGLCSAGKLYAMVIMKTMMVHVLRRYSLRSRMKIEDIEYELKVVMFSKNPVPLQFLSH